MIAPVTAGPALRLDALRPNPYWERPGAATGLDDFGDADFREGLRILLDDIRM